MSDYSAVSEFDQYIVKRRPDEKTDDKFFKLMKIVVSVLCAMLLLELLLYKFVQPSVRASRVVFEGLKSYTAEELTQEILPFCRANYFSFDTAAVASRLSAVSGIESVEIEKRFPDKIIARIKERESVAMTFVSDGGKTIPVQIDKNCVLFEGGSAALDSDVPIVSGLPVEFLSGGMRIPSKYRTLIDQIGRIREMPQKYFAAVSEICVLPKKYGNYELMIIPINSRARVLTDRALNERALQYMMVALEVVNSIAPDATEIDLRYGSVSYRTPHGGSGE
ncbi:MAG: FtsQ-type POTRA domain-containing protein [Treponema sp.]|jgi:cell division protein FtsQ|nr:FtsQ-type POTRA domain-containing protein [Treponema sp.]